MKQKLTILTLVFIIIGVPTAIAINCGDSWTPNGNVAEDWHLCNTSPLNEIRTGTVTQPWTIFWINSILGRDVNVRANGQCRRVAPVEAPEPLLVCVPAFSNPYWHSNNIRLGVWNQLSQDGVYTSPPACDYTGPIENHFSRYVCARIAELSHEECTDSGYFWNFAGNNCSETDPNADPCANVTCEYGNPLLENDPNGCCNGTPVLIDVAGNGFALTDASHGVVFNLSHDNTSSHLAWTVGNSDDAWLVLDRNGNGTIDNGMELFGNFTPQSSPPTGIERNGFLALAEYDKAANGGNNDGVIDSRDSIFSSLRLWQDMNHNGSSEAGELHRLPELSVVTLELNYKESKRTDQYGNQFRYRAKVKDTHGAQVGRWAWDVFLVAGD